MWVYQGALQVEYQAVELSKYRIALAEDRQRIQEVKHARLSQTHFQSPQLSLFELDGDDWLLFLKLPDYTPRQRRRQATAIQPPLFDDHEAAPADASDEHIGDAPTPAPDACRASHVPPSGFAPLPLGGVGQRLPTGVYPFDGDQEVLWAAQGGTRTVGGRVHHQAWLL